MHAHAQCWEVLYKYACIVFYNNILISVKLDESLPFVSEAWILLG